MPFVENRLFNYPSLRPPVRVYQHESGKELFCPEGQIDRSTYILESLKDWRRKIDNNLRDVKLDYFIGILWASQGKPILDLFGYGGISRGDQNPEVYSWVITDGEWGRGNPITCGDGLILLGMEEEGRRQAGSLDEYISLGGITPVRINDRIRGLAHSPSTS